MQNNFILQLKRKKLQQPKFIPMSKNEMNKLGWNTIDVLLITGDAFVDHPSFGIAVIARVLIAAGYKVGIIAQPNWHDSSSLNEFGQPNLACAISSGNMESMLNIYTAARRLRKKDSFSPGGAVKQRPTNSLTVYANLARSAFSNVPIIIGGLEASMRRITHYDYWKDKLMPSILVNTKADLLIYGMAEKALINAIDSISKKQDFTGEKGTAVILGAKKSEEIKEKIIENYQILPSHENILSQHGSLLESHVLAEKEMNPYSSKGTAQKYSNRFIIIEPPPIPLTTAEIDAVYDLPYSGLPHPKYNKTIPAYEMIKDSVTAVRGCPGGCSFCGLGLHQGKLTSFRSKESIIREIIKLSGKKDFHGTISDIGGPTANSYANSYIDIEKCHNCKRPSCLYPKICNNYFIDEKEFLKLLELVSNIPKIKHVFISSGLRLDLALQQKKLMKTIIKNHVSGHMKVAPEHLDDDVLKLMRKCSSENFYNFLKFFKSETNTTGKKQYIIPYFISNFPGSSNKSMDKVNSFLNETQWSLQQVQDFIPLPMTIASAMYYDNMDCSSRTIKVNKGLKERRYQLNLLKKDRNRH